MREILFRGKRVDNGEWVYGDLLHYGKYTSIRINLTKHGSIPNYVEFIIIPETVGQFTGFTDIMGVKVFEGDNAGEGIVVYDEYYSAFMINFPLKNKKMYFEDIVRIFVSGNIHDNPELH